MNIMPRIGSIRVPPALSLVVIIAGCGGDAPPKAAVGSSSAVVTPSPSPSAYVEDLGAYSPPEFDAGGLIATPKGKRVRVWERPDAAAPPASVFAARNPIDQKLGLLVLEARRTEDGTGWLEVLLPRRPNGSRGWMKVDDAELAYVDQRIEVDLSDYALTYFRDGRAVETFEVGIGQDRYPTPTGIFYIWAYVSQPDPAGPYGNLALGLSGFSPVLSDWPGGGRSAIHGTADADDRGAKVSHGCVRVYNDDMKKLRKVPLGTPVIIRP